MKICKVEDCGEKHQAKGLCNMHYKRLKEHGSLSKIERPIKVCQVDGCNSKYRSKGLCGKHYQRKFHNGDPLITKTPNRNKSRKWIIENNSIPVTESGCWLWEKATNRGYGVTYHEGKKQQAHRLSYKEYLGEIPEGMCVCHKCDVPGCVNPSHLFVGSHKDNAHDKISKGRSNTAKGERTGSSKLSKEDVIDVRFKIKEGHNLMALALLYNVHQASISGIKRRITWKHV